jgi:hypothetical protein
MNERFETLGNATLQFFADGRPVLVTDPWLVGTCYFGSWALDHDLSAEQIANALGSDYVWLSHGHPDHMHHESLDLFRPGQKFLLPDHYDREIEHFLTGKGFAVTILKYREWFRISPTVEVMCLDNMNQDAILFVKLGDALVIDQNDSPTAGEFSFMQAQVKRHPNDKTYLAALCSIDADMFNFVDADGKSVAGPPDERKKGAIWNVARDAERLGVKNFCCSSSQHIYARADSVWANPYRISWADMQAHWTRPEVRLIEPFVTVTIADGAVTANYDAHGTDRPDIGIGTGDDDWSATLSAEEWGVVEAFFRRFELVRDYVDFIAVTIGGETRQFDLNPPPPEATDARGIQFHAPKQSFMETMKWGFFDDLLIGNFMKVRLTNTSLYPRFTPLVAKLGGNAKVYTRAQYRQFLLRYFRRNPVGAFAYLLEPEKNYVIMPWLRERAESLGVKEPLKRVYRSMRGDPVAKSEAGDNNLAPPEPGSVLKFPAAHAPILVVSVDTEENFDWTAPYSSDATAVHGMAEIAPLQLLFEKAGVKPIYMIDYAVANQPEGYLTLLDIAERGGCEIGAHLHPWVNPPVLETLCARNSYPFNLPRELEREKLRILTETIEANLGVRPRSYKAGRYGVGAGTVGLLLEQGYKVDLSVVPRRDYGAEEGPDFHAFDDMPFWLDPDRRLLELPLTTSFIGALHERADTLFREVDSAAGRTLHLPGVFARLGLMNRVNLTPEGVTLKEAKALTRMLLEKGQRVFTMAFHSTSLTPGSTPYVKTEADRDALYRWLEEYFAFFAGEIGGRFMTPLALYELCRGLGLDQRRSEALAQVG